MNIKKIVKTASWYAIAIFVFYGGFAVASTAVELICRHI